MKTLLVVYHSQSGRTAQLVKAVVDGATREPGVSVLVLPAEEASASDWLGSDGIVFASPENAGHLSGGLKDYLDRCFYAVQDKPGMPYACVISAGNDGSQAVHQLARIVTGCRMTPVAEPVVVRGAPDAHGLQQCRDLGQALAAGLVMGIF